MRKSAVNVRNSKGFNITELIVVMGIIAVIVAIAAPAAVSQITHLRLTRSVRDVVTELNAARFKAIAKNKRYQVEFTVNSGATPPDSYQLQSWDGAAYVDEPGRAAGLLGEGISITSPVSNFNTEFYPNGSSTATTICVDNTNKSSDRMKITVKGATGMIQVTTGC